MNVIFELFDICDIKHDLYTNIVIFLMLLFIVVLGNHIL